MNLNGKTFGRLTVIRRVDDRTTKGGNVITRWFCKCVCGIEKVIMTSSLLQGKTKSCGCLFQETIRKNGFKNKKHGGYSQGSSANDRVKFQALVNIRERARRNGYESDLGLDDLPVLTDTCPIFGIGYEKGSLKNKDLSPSIDRKVSDLPYLRAYKDNLVFISHRANRIKSNATADELIKIATYMRGHSFE